jgi:hypothetical protein
MSNETADSNDRFLYLTTTGRVSGLPRRIEIWFVEHGGCYYVIAERREAAQWVKNIEHDSKVRFGVAARGEAAAEVPATACVVRETALVDTIAALMETKYGWSDGLVVEIRPVANPADA